MNSLASKAMESDPSNDGLKQQIMSTGSLPKHIAFIMDGNGRWAKQRFLPRIAGHNRGVQTVREMVEIGTELKIEVMTFYTFSTENWKRPKIEVSALMNLLLESVNRELDDLIKNDVQLRVIGELENVPLKPRKVLQNAIDSTRNNQGLKLVLAISYSGRQEIIKAANKLIRDGVKEVTESKFAKYLDTKDIPDPDLLIRTSGEFRLSNFLLYQLAYSEIIVTSKFWPEFSNRDLFECILKYQRRERRFGKTSDQLG